jgi:hypothetical protein
MHLTEQAAVHYAAVRANRERGLSFCVWKKEDTYFVRGPNDGDAHIDATLICIAQHWSDSPTGSVTNYSTVQLRYPGARSEWVNF